MLKLRVFVVGSSGDQLGKIEKSLGKSGMSYVSLSQKGDWDFGMWKSLTLPC